MRGGPRPGAGRKPGPGGCADRRVMVNLTAEEAHKLDTLRGEEPRSSYLRFLLRAARLQT